MYPAAPTNRRRSARRHAAGRRLRDGGQHAPCRSSAGEFWSALLMKGVDALAEVVYAGIAGANQRSGEDQPVDEMTDPLVQRVDRPAQPQQRIHSPAPALRTFV